MKLFHPFATAISVAGHEYEVVKGWVEVEAEHVEHLFAHGFTTEKPKPADPAPDKAVAA